MGRFYLTNSFYYIITNLVLSSIPSNMNSTFFAVKPFSFSSFQLNERDKEDCPGDADEPGPIQVPDP
jgi:hypothetical protein